MTVKEIDYEAAKLEAVESAIKTVLEMKLPEDVFISAELLTMGQRLSKIYTRQYQRVAEIHGVNNLGKLAAMANKYYWISCHEAANTMRFYSLLERQYFQIDEKLFNAEGYADSEGWANTLYDYQSHIDICEEINGMGFKDDVLIFIGLYWLNIAEKLQDNSDKFDYITEGLLAFESVNADDMYIVGMKSEQDQAKEIRSNAAKLGHVDTYELKAQAIEYWREHIDPSLSNDAAADILTKVVAVKFRKLSEYVAEAKRENIHPAS